MSNELRDLSLKVVLGQMNRRDFIGRAAALGLAAPLATKLLSGTARATPVRGGHLVMGLHGGAPTDSPAPGLAPSTVPPPVQFGCGECRLVTDPTPAPHPPRAA